MDLTLEILTNREKYPDTAEITLADGQKITVKQFRDTLQPRAEFTRASEGWAREKKSLEDAQTGLQQQLSALNAQFQKALEDKKALEGRQPVKAGGDGEITEDELARDPILGPIMRAVKATTAAMDDVKKTMKEQGDRIAQHETTWVTRDYQNQLAGLGSRFTARFNK